MAIATRSNRLLGAPGVFSAPASPVRRITGVRRDTAAFLGVAPRGPARRPLHGPADDDDLALWLTTTRHHRSIPRLVTSWNEYRHHFGGFDGPGRLPYAVSAFFGGGGERAWIVRTVHDYANAADDADARAAASLDGVETTADRPVIFHASSEGGWGNRLRAGLSFQQRPLPLGDPWVPAGPTELIVDEREWVPQGSLLRIDLGNDVVELVYVDDSRTEPDPAGPGRRRHLRLVAPVAWPVPPDEPVISVVTCTMHIIDTDPATERRERLTDLGLHPLHPRFLPRAVVNESELVWPAPEWVGDPLDTDDLHVMLPDLTWSATGPDGTLGTQFAGGRDRWQDIEPDDYFDDTWGPGAEQPGDGIASIAEHDDIGLVAVPDLYDPLPLVANEHVPDPPTLCGPDFGEHVEATPTPAPDPPPFGLDGLALDPALPEDLEIIVGWQRRLADWADRRRDLTVLLDVPLGLTHRRVLRWRTHFDSPHIAAYHPWIDVALADDRRDALVRINPSGFAAAIVAERELRLGVQFGPANQVAAGAIRLADTIAPQRHDELHRAGVNVFATTHRGIELTGARTLTRRSELRQLSVARLMTVLRLSLEREMAWVVFEPNNEALWRRVQDLIGRFLTRLYDAGAFRGRSTKEAFFVRCDRTTMTPNDIDNGRLVVLVGVAPAEPIEYIVVEIALNATEGVRVEVTA